MNDALLRCRNEYKKTATTVPFKSPKYAVYDGRRIFSPTEFSSPKHTVTKIASLLDRIIIKVREWVKIYDLPDSAQSNLKMKSYEIYSSERIASTLRKIFTKRLTIGKAILKGNIYPKCFIIIYICKIKFLEQNLCGPTR